ESEEDNGGVHHNSGVNSKAVFLMVDGGSFNGKTVTALGWTKTVAIYYEVNNAVDAVEMNGQPAPNFNTEAPYCDAGNPVTTIFSDDLESGTGNWTFT